MDSKKKQQLIDYGKGWLERDIFSVEVNEDRGNYRVGINWGDDYYGTDLYKKRDHALCEAKGYLEGIKAQIDGWLEYIDKELGKEETNGNL